MSFHQRVSPSRRYALPLWAERRKQIRCICTLGKRSSKANGGFYALLLDWAITTGWPITSLEGNYIGGTSLVAFLKEVQLYIEDPH